MPPNFMLMYLCANKISSTRAWLSKIDIKNVGIHPLNTEGGGDAIFAFYSKNLQTIPSEIS